MTNSNGMSQDMRQNIKIFFGENAFEKIVGELLDVFGKHLREN